MSPKAARGAVLRLAGCQALAGANATVFYATGAIVGAMLAPHRGLATLPITIFVIGTAACTLPAGALAQRYGRHAAFMAGCACGVAAGLIASAAMVLGSFWLYCAAAFFGGAYAAVVLSFRFAAADCVAPERRARALSAVMAGGVFAGVIGPQLVTATMDRWPPYPFAATYVAQAAVAVLSAVILIGVRLPPPATAQERRGGRSLAAIARDPRFIVAALCGVVTYMLMNFVMTSAPLAMRMCGLSQESSNLGLQWHVIAMYGPSFFTGRLIARFGAARVVMAGLILTAAAAVTGLGGEDIGHFWGALVLLGLGWNFGFVGASAMVLDCHAPEERARVQSLNDFIVFGAMVVASLASGGVLTVYGWTMVCLVTLPPLALAAAALVLSGGLRRPAQA